jgi:mannonate dehydratase
LKGWGHAGNADESTWSVERLRTLRTAIEAEGLRLHAIENLDPAVWHDILLDGPKRAEQIERVRTILRNMGEAGIPMLGIYFSLAGVSGRTRGPYARGGAESVGMEGEIPAEPIPNGMVWNMVYDADAPAGSIRRATEEELWKRRRTFLEAVLPTAAQAGVVIASHPDDPPLPRIRDTARLIHAESHVDRLVADPAHPNNKLEFCCGTLAEMAGCDVYTTLERHARAGNVGYVHFRNVTGKAPSYRETFLDDGDVDMQRLVHILHDADFNGVVIPDHAPQMACEAPWHAGMAWAMGYMKAAMDAAAKGTACSR